MKISVLSYFAILLLCLLVSPVVTLGQITPTGWYFDCADDIEVEVAGKGLWQVQTPVSLQIPNPSSAQYIVAEAVCKYVCPDSVIFDSPNGPITVAGTPLTFIGSSFPQQAKAYRAVIPGGPGVDSVSLIKAHSFYFYSFVSYIFRTGPGYGGQTAGFFVNEMFHHNSKTYTLTIPADADPRDLTIDIPVTDMNPDARIAIFTAHAGSVSDSVVISTFDPILGQSLAIVTLTLKGVPGNVTTITLRVESPPGNGDSFMIGAALNVNIDCPNKAPVAVDDFNNTLVGIPAGGNVLVNDFDPDGDSLSVTPSPLTGPSNGTVTLASDGSYLYTPNAGFEGNDVFTYEVCDDFLPPACDTARVIIKVRESTGGGNHAPVANPDYTLTRPGTAVSSNLLVNDWDPDGDSIILNTLPLSGPANGTVSIASNGTYTYTPNAGFEGQDHFAYAICDDGSPSLCDTADVTILVLPDYNGPDNDPPFAGDDAFATRRNVPVSGDVSLNDLDPNGDNLVYTSTPFSPPAHGVVTLSANGTFTYTPDQGYYGPDRFVYEVCDDGSPSLCTKATVYLVVTGFNRAPFAINDFNNTLKNIPVSGNVLTNDFDPDGDSLIVSTATVFGPLSGSVVLQPDGSYTYTPNSGFTGADGFIYIICDNGFPGPLCDSNRVFIDVRDFSQTNQPPVANDDAFITFPGQRINGNILSNDWDPNGDSLILNTTPNFGPSHGTLVINPDGSISYLPNPGFIGQDDFTYTICDNAAIPLCDPALVSIYVIPDYNGPENDPPVAGDDAFGTPEDIPYAGTVKRNDYDLNGDSLIYSTTVVSGPAHGTVTLNADGTFIYQPDSAYYGPDRFVYEVCDNVIPSLCTHATVYATVTPVNRAPIAVHDINLTLPNTAVDGNVLTNDFDPDGDALTVNTTPLSGPLMGNLVLRADGTYTYTPGPGFDGTDSFVYQVCDNGVPGPLCDIGEVTIYVRTATLKNAKPVVVDDEVLTFVDQPVTSNLLTNDWDPNGDALILDTVTINGPVFGTVLIHPNGTFTYTPRAGFEGDDTFVYEVCDDVVPSLCDRAIVTIRVIPDYNGSENNPPFAGDDAGATLKNQPLSGDVSLNDTDPNGDNLVYTTTPLEGPFNGTLTLNADGTFSYQPDSAYTGPDRFRYEVCDDGTPSLCVQATAYITVLPSNRPPFALDDINNVFAGMSTFGNVLTNDFDPDGGDTLTVSTTAVSGPNQGSLVLNSDGSYTYSAPASFIGTDQFSYQVCDNGIPGPKCDTATVTIKVRDPRSLSNQPPVANNDVLITFVGVTVSSNLLANDWEPNGDSIILNTSPVAGPTHGVAAINPDGSFSYTPDPSFIGIDRFAYTICDDQTPSLCDTAEVIVLVIPDYNGPENNPPFAGDDVFATPRNTVLNKDVSLNDYDLNGDNLVYTTTPVSGPLHGTVAMNADGTFSYTPAPAYFGVDVFIYEVCDDGSPSLCTQATALIIVTGGNRAPIAVSDINNTLINTPVGGNVLTNDFDPDGDSLFVSVSAIFGPLSGNLILNVDGSYVYTPDPGFTGIDGFLYEVCDNGIPGPLCDTSRVFLKIRDFGMTNQPPVANDDVTLTRPGVAVSGNVLANDWDPNGDSLIVNTTPTGGPINGNVILNANGTYTYTPDAGFEGVDNFIYMICDDGTPSMCDQAFVSIYVLPDYNGPENDPPFAGDDAVSVLRNWPVSGDLSLNDLDPNGDNLIYQNLPVSGPDSGTVTINANGAFTYTPNQGFVGPDRFVYKVCDDGSPSLCAYATAYITVIPANRRPIAINDINYTLRDVAVSGNVLTNDVDLDMDLLSVTPTPVTAPASGTVSLASDGSYTYYPATGFTGKDSFSYEVCDNGTPGPYCDTARVTIAVLTLVTGNNPPVAMDDQFLTYQDLAVSSNVLSNDLDLDGDNLTVNALPLSGPAHGAVVLSANGAVTYTPAPGFFGTDQFTYKVCDNGSPVLCDSAVVEIIVLNTTGNEPPGNNAPFAGDDVLILPKDSSRILNISLNDYDLDGDNLTYSTSPVAGPLFGVASISASGLLTYTPNPGYIGPDRIIYRVCDDGTPSLCSFATVYLLVLPDSLLPCISMNFGVFLEGAYNASTGLMATRIRELGYLPGQTPLPGFSPTPTPTGQPYNTNPWFHAGTEGDGYGDGTGQVAYPSTVTDWVLVSLRKGGNLPADEVFKQAALLHSDGTIEMVGPCYAPADTGSYWIVIEHRNHVGVMSPQPVAPVQGSTGIWSLDYDFRDKDSYKITFTVGQKILDATSGVFGMFAADGEKTGQQNYEINGNDRTIWLQQNGTSEKYQIGDFNLDIDVNGSDNSLWLQNNGLASGVPK